MIPICLVTGFLGSGKTTFLKRVVARHRQEKIVYLVNEFSPQDVDGALVAEEDAAVVAIPGGSIFCKCLVVGFLQHLKSIPERYDTPDAPVAGVVIEASGIANPKVVQQMLAETQMDQVYRLATILTVVDARSFLKLIHTLPNIKAQVECADHVILNKADITPEEALVHAESEIQAIQPGAAIARTAFCDVAIDLFGPAPAREIQGEYALCADPNYGRLQVAFAGAVDVDRLKEAVMSVREDVYRAKGTVPTLSGPVFVDYAEDDFAASCAAVDVSGLAFIVRGGSEAHVRAALADVPGLAMTPAEP